MLKLTIFLLAIGLTVGLKNDPECDIKLAGRNCVKTGFLVAYNKAFPRTDEEMNSMCENVKLGEECAKKFIEKCAENDKEKRSLDITLQNTNRALKPLCETDTKKAEFLKNVKECGNAILHDSSHKCTKKFMEHLMMAAEMDDKEKIKKVVCCKAMDIPKCIKEVMDGKSECNDDNKKYMETVRRSIADGMKTDLCTEFDKDPVAKCAGLEVPEFRGEIEKGSAATAIKKILDKVRN